MFEKMADICHRLDAACPRYEFFYSDRGGVAVICVYDRPKSDEEPNQVATIDYPEHDRDYVLTKILLQFS